MKINTENHGKQLTLGRLALFLDRVKAAHPDDWHEIPVYLGDDDELNGTHCAWYTNYIPTADKDDEECPWRETINDYGSGYPLGDNEVAIIIS